MPEEPVRALPVLPWTLIKFTPRPNRYGQSVTAEYTVTIDGQEVGIFSPMASEAAIEWLRALPTAEQHEANISQVRAQMHAMGLRGMPGQ